MRSVDEHREDRVLQTGADILSITEATVLLAVGDCAAGPTWRHPVWALCRGLAALGFGAVHLRAPQGYYEALAPLMEGAWFVPEASGDPARSEDDAAYDVVLHLDDGPEPMPRSDEIGQPRPAYTGSLAWGETWVSLRTASGSSDDCSPRGVDAASGQQPLPPIARIAAGLGLQEAIIAAGQLRAAADANPVVAFDSTTETRAHGGPQAPWPPVWVEGARIDVVGAGAVGSHLLESLAPLLGANCELRIFDPDVVNPENLGVCPTYTIEAIGRPKVEAMTDNLQAICDPQLDVRPFAMRYEDRPQSLAPPSLRIAAPDSFSARKYLNDASIADGIPLVEAGCSPLTAQQRSYLPGRTSCLEHRMVSLSSRAAAERDRASCSLERALTLPGVSMIAGGIMALEALRALEPQLFGWPAQGTVVYDVRFPERFGMIDARSPCAHR